MSIGPVLAAITAALLVTAPMLAPVPGPARAPAGTIAVTPVCVDGIDTRRTATLQVRTDSRAPPGAFVAGASHVARAPGRTRVIRLVARDSGRVRCLASP